MTAPTAAMVKAGAEFMRAFDADPAVDYGYEEFVTLLWGIMEKARATERWDDAVARELVRTGRLRGTRL